MNQKKDEEKEQTNLSDLKDAFQAFDKDNDGFISIKELRTIMLTFGFKPTMEEIRNLIKEYDKDENDVIELNEFIDLMNKKIKEQEEEQDLFETFELFDRNGDGMLEKEELKLLLQSIGEDIDDSLLSDFFIHADLDRDGFLNIGEFVSFMKGD